MVLENFVPGIRDLLSSLLLATSVLRDTTIRFDCHPEPEPTREACENRGCLWGSPPVHGAPWCYLQQGFGYTYESTSGPEAILKKNNGPRNPWGEDIERVHFRTGTIGKTLNVKIFVPGRYEPPVNFTRHPSDSSETLKVTTGVKNDVFSFAVHRESTGGCIFDTSIGHILIILYHEFEVGLKAVEANEKNVMEMGGLIFSDKFIQLATYLPSEAMYGLGENVHPTLKHDFAGYRTWALFARDEFPVSSTLRTINLYGMHAFYLMLEPDGNAHGVFILNSNAQEFTTAPGPALIYRTIGGNLDLYFFPGPTPEEVIQQYHAFIGTPTLPAYWAFGFQLSRYGYKDLNEMMEKVDRNINAGVPLETTVADIEYMDRYKDFTVGKHWKDLPKYIRWLQREGRRAILIWDPAIQVDDAAFERALKMDARFIEWERYDQVMRSIQDQYPLVKDTKIMLGVVWPDRHIAFPDFLDENTRKWWIEEFIRFWKEVPFDGIWIDMNEPANFGTNEAKPWYFENPDHPNIPTLYCPVEGPDSSWDMPPYKTHNVWLYGKEAILATKTLCMLALQANDTQRFYNVKGLYGLHEAEVTLAAQYAATNRRGAVVSRSTFASAGRYAGHWLGDNSANWEDLQTSVIGAQEFNMFGIPYVGSDICGFFGDATEELCLRWQQMGAFHTFMRNHNAKGQAPQDPAKWPSVAEAAKKAILFRYYYLPYLYSVFFAVSMNGGTVIRPVFFEFWMDKETHNLGHQFLWGSSMMIAPVLHKGATTVDAYLPDDVWYSLYDHNYGRLVSTGYSTFPARWTSLIPVFVRGGSILPRQKPEMTTTASRKNPFELLIAPHYSEGVYGSADGFLFWDDGETIIHSFASHNYFEWSFKFYCDTQHATLFIRTDRHAEDLKIPTLDTLEIFNYKYKPNLDSFTLNGTKITIKHSITPTDRQSCTFEISKRRMIDISTAHTYTLSWTHATT